MAELPTGFNPEDDYGTFGNEVLPAGKYTAHIVESERKENSKGTGSYIKLVMEVLEGPHKGRKIFENLNLWHKNAVTVRIAMAEMKQLCNACGGLRPAQTEELHSIPFIVKLGLRKREDTGEMQNSIKGFSAPGAEPEEAATTGGAEDKPAWKK